MKKSSKRHFETDIHIKNWNIWSKKNDEKRAVVKRNHEVGMRLARLCYVDYKEGNSKRHYEQEVLKAVQNGLDMGEINHSDQFPRMFRPFATRLSKREGALNITKDATKIAETEVMSLVSKLYTDLSKEIFEEETVQKIEVIRNICDIKSLSEMVLERGSALVGLLSADTFVKSAKEITQTVQQIPDDILKANYLDFLKVLEDHIKSKSKKTLDSKDIIRDFLDIDKKLYKGVEITVHCICAAAIKISVESDVESLVSRYEKHFKADRQFCEDNVSCRVCRRF